MTALDSTCGFCRRRGEPCKKHGGTDSQLYRSRYHHQGAGKAVEEALERKKASGIAETGIKLPTPDFEDKFGCSMCVMKGSLCDIHERYVRDQEAKGATTTNTYTPVAATLPPPTPEGVKTTEQKVGEFRVVQIKVGEVVITIKEPFRDVAA